MSTTTDIRVICEELCAEICPFWSMQGVTKSPMSLAPVYAEPVYAEPVYANMVSTNFSHVL